jgi:hypothetical protein
LAPIIGVNLPVTVIVSPTLKHARDGVAFLAVVVDFTVGDCAETELNG